MITIFDVGYFEQPDGSTVANVGIVSVELWRDSESKSELRWKHHDVREYQPGQFFRRELPCLVSAIEGLSLTPAVMVVDGYVYLDQDNSPGLGAYLFQHFDKRIPVVGVGKNAFKGSQHAKAVYRGESQNPIFVTSAGLDLEVAANHVKNMHGEYRIPTVLKRVDQLSRTF